MAIIDMTEMRTENAANEELTGGAVVAGARRVFSLTADSPDDDATTARKYPSLPALGSRLPGDESLICRRKEARRRGRSREFLVTCTYTAPDRAGTAASRRPANPLAEPAQVEWSEATSQEPVDVDVNGRPYANTAGVPFDPPHQREVVDMACRVTRNEPRFDTHRRRKYRNVVNSDPWLGYRPFQVRLRSMTAASVAEWRGARAIEYWRVSYNFLMRDDPQGWRVRIFNSGTTERIQMADGPDRHRAITGPDGQAISEPVPLDETGRAVDPREYDEQPGTPRDITLDNGQKAQKFANGHVWLLFDDYRAVPFRPLGLERHIRKR